ncbi:Vegetative incompatibility protein HET-E-1 [Nymphon striatum]|nr:Vegetative incompatibility protein HET-E-1 [Nymphon striatum]
MILLVALVALAKPWVINHYGLYLNNWIPSSYDLLLIAATPEGSTKEKEVMKRLQAALNNAPVNTELDKKKIRLSGFISPLEIDEKEGVVKEFLLVPYFGACIHVPPPPLNQTLLIKPAKDQQIKLEDAYEPIWISGVIHAESTVTKLAEAVSPSDWRLSERIPVIFEMVSSSGKSLPKIKVLGYIMLETRASLHKRLTAFLLFSVLLFIPFSMPFAEGERHDEKESKDKSQERSQNLVGHGGPVNTVAVSPNGGKAISGSLDYAVMLWDIKPPQITKKPKRFVEHRGAVSAVIFLPSGTHALSSGDDGIVYLWDVNKKELQHKFEGHKAKVVALSVSENSRIAASASWDGTIRLWDLEAKKALHEITIQNEIVNTVLISADAKRVYSGGRDGKLRSWNAETGELIKVIHTHGWPINIMRWLPDHKHIVLGTSNGDVQVLDINTHKINKILIPHEKPVLGLAVSSKHNLFASGGSDGVIRVWKIKDWSSIGETQTVPGPVWALAFSGDGKGMYYGSLDDEVKFWEIAPISDENWWKKKKTRRFQVKSGLPLGELQFARKCSVCHTLSPTDANRAGPTLHKIFGRKAGSLPDYPYSEGVKKSKVIWNKKSIDELFTKGPQAVVPGSKMPLQKIPNDKNREALIEYLRNF